MGDLLLKRSAVLSDCGRYRYELRRVWSPEARPLYFGMLNPSTADHLADDPTITRGMVRAQQNGFGSLIVWNLGAGRATDPADWMRMDDPIGPDNDVWIERLLTECRERNGLTCAGWGVHGDHRGRHIAVVRMAERIGVQLYCLGATKSGAPRHPLYVSYEQPFVPYPSLRGQP